MNNNAKTDKLDTQNIFIDTELPATITDISCNKNEDIQEGDEKKIKTGSKSKGSKIQNNYIKKSLGKKNDKKTTEQKNKMNHRSYHVSEELLTAQKETLETFNRFDVKEPSIKDDYVDMYAVPPEKPNFFQRMCLCASQPTLRRWFIDSDNFALSGVSLIFLNFLSIIQ